MNRYTLISLGYIVPIVFSLVLTGAVGVYTWRRRNVAGARSFAVVLLFEAIWVGCILGKLMVISLEAKIFFDNLRWVSTFLVPLALLSFSFEYTGTRILRAVRFWTLMMVVPTIALVMIFTNGWHGLAMIDQRLVFSPPFAIYVYLFGIPILLGSAYNYMVIFVAIILMSSFALRQAYLYRVQMIVIVVGVLIPVAGSVLSLMDIHIGPQRDMYPYTTTVGNLFIAVGLFAFHIFDIVPIAREQVFEGMEDGVIVVDSLGRLVDINRAAREFLGQPDLRAYGQPLNQLPRSWASQIMLDGHSHQSQELLVADPDGERYYDLRIKRLENTKSRTAGHLIMLRDISKRRKAESQLQQAYAEMEWRVRERTEQLSSSVARLEEEIRERQRAESELRESYDATLEGWSRALEMRERETAGHSRRVVELALALAQSVGMDETELVNIRRGAMLHDIGKMGVPDSILLKAGPLTSEEWMVMRQHPLLAYNALSRVAFLRPALDIPYCHHEHWDGTGYPRGLQGKEIPLAARLFAVIDVWDALNSERPYRAAWPPEKVLAYLTDEAGKQFDPQMVDAFLKVLERI